MCYARLYVCVCVRHCVCVYVRVYACVHACARACAHAHVIHVEISTHQVLVLAFHFV